MGSIFDKPSRFRENGQQYEMVEAEHKYSHRDIHRFTYGQEPMVIAQVPVVGGGKVEVRGIAVWWSPTHMQIEWMDERLEQFNCWLIKTDVRLVDVMNWGGRYVPR